MRRKKDETDLFSDDTENEECNVTPLSISQFQKLTEQLGKRRKDTILSGRRALGRKHYHECVCPCYKGSKKGICKALG